MIKLTNVKEAYWSSIGYDPFYDEYVLVVPIVAGHYKWEVFYKVPKEYYDMASPDCEFLKTLSDNIFTGNAMGLANYELTFLGSTAERGRIVDLERWNDPRYDTL